MSACPKCGALVAPGAVICPACDFVVDMSFLEDYTGEHKVLGDDDDPFGEKTAALTPRGRAAAAESLPPTSPGFAAAPRTMATQPDPEGRTAQTASGGDEGAPVQLADFEDDGQTEAGLAITGVELLDGDDAAAFDDDAPPTGFARVQKTDPDDVFGGEGAFFENTSALSAPLPERPLTDPSVGPPRVQLGGAPEPVTADAGLGGESDEEMPPTERLVIDADEAAAIGRALASTPEAPSRSATDGTADVDFRDDAAEDEIPIDDDDDSDGELLIFDDASGEHASSEGSAYGGEALILGDVGGDFESILSNATSSFALPDGVQRVLEPAPVYIAESLQEMLEPNAVLALTDGVDPSALALSDVEQKVVALVDGERPVARIGNKAGLQRGELKIAVSMLADRKLIVVKGHIKPDALSLLEEGDLDETGEVTLPPPAASTAQHAPLGAGIDLDPPMEPMAAAPEELPADALIPMELPADALQPLDLPLDALQPLPVPAAAPEPPPFAGGATGDKAFPGGGVRPALDVKPATVATASKAAVAARPAPTRPAPAAPGVPMPWQSTPGMTAPSRAAAVVIPAAKGPPVPGNALHPVDPVAQTKAQQMLELALTDLRAGKKARALAFVKMAADLDPNNEQARDLIDNWAKAESIARSESEDQKLVADAQRLEDQGRFDDAIAVYKKVIALKPVEPELHNRLGILLALRKKDYGAATAALMKATELAPDNLAYRSNLGKVFKLSEGKKGPVRLHAGSESDALKKELKAHQKKGFLDRLRGK